jgi:hypothetical protein
MMPSRKNNKRVFAHEAFVGMHFASDRSEWFMDIIIDAMQWTQVRDTTVEEADA